MPSMDQHYTALTMEQSYPLSCYAAVSCPRLNPTILLTMCIYSSSHSSYCRYKIIVTFCIFFQFFFTLEEKPKVIQVK